MKTQIENSLILKENDNEEMLIAFNEIIQTCTLANNQEELRRMLKGKSFYIDRYFHYGFGANHMWVKQNLYDDRILIVQF